MCTSSSKCSRAQNRRAVTTHTLAQTRGAYITNTDHIPSNMDHTRGLWTSVYFLCEAQKIGPSTRTFIEEMNAAKAIPAQAYQSCRNVLSMGKHANKLVLEEACKRLVSSYGTRRAVSYTAIKNLMVAVRKEAATRPHGFNQPAPAAPGHPDRTPAAATRDTSGAYLGGAPQFSLDNLTKKGTTTP